MIHFIIFCLICFIDMVFMIKEMMFEKKRYNHIAGEYWIYLAIVLSAPFIIIIGA